MAEAQFVSGKTTTQDHTPSAAVLPGTVLVVGIVPFVAPVAIAADQLGSVDVSGGVYKCTTDGTLTTGGAAAYWDDTAKKVTATALSNTHFGYTGPDQGAAADGEMIEVSHLPSGIVA